MTTTYITNAGATIVSRKIVERTGNIKWLTREAPIAPQDTGWRILSDRDTDEYLADPANMTVVDFNDICDIEPACIGIYDLPVGSDIQLVVEPDGRRRWFDNKTEREIIFE